MNDLFSLSLIRPRPHLTVWVLALVLAASLPLPRLQSAEALHRIPVILDTDIGDDIDDTWALGILLQSPEFDLKLVVGDYGKVEYRARLLAKFLQRAGRTDVPVGLGLDIAPKGDGPQAGWITNFALADYRGQVFKDGVQALIDTILGSKVPITLIAIGPMPNLAAALEREPKIAQHARFVGMDGSVRVGYGGSTNAAAEWNVKADVKAAQRAFSAPWEMLITPLDTCGLVDLSGDRYRRVRNSANPIAASVIENYRLWSLSQDPKNKAAESHSTTLFDTVAVYLAARHDLCRIEQLGLRVTDEGFTVIDEHAKRVSVATDWKSLDGYRDWVVERLTGPSASGVH
jgi:inosine-uridine nucleoside N-ribohydrolase